MAARDHVVPHLHGANMSARDDYPRLAWIEQWDAVDGVEARYALDEIDRLRAIAEAANNLEIATHLINRKA